MSVRSTKAGGSGRDRSLSEGTIVEATLGLISRHGASALTMRMLADDLGVTPMASYYYVSGKEDLLRLVGEHVLAGVGVAASDAGTWDERLRSLISEQRRVLKEYPGLREALSGVDLVQRRRLEDAEFEILTEAGFSASGAVAAFRALLDWSLGNAYVDSSLRDPAMRRPPERLNKAQQAAVKKSARISADETFAFGLNTIIDGLRAALAAQRALAPKRQARPRRSHA